MSTESPHTIETLRLVMRPFDAKDLEAAFEWFSDPEVMRFIAGGAHTNIQQTSRRLADYRAHQELRGFSKWIVIEEESGRAIGDSGLLALNELGPVPDLGFRFAKPFWGRGFATEVASA